MDCNDLRPKLIEHLYGELSEQENRSLITHLEGCDDCRRRVKEMKSNLLAYRNEPSMTAPKNAIQFALQTAREQGIEKPLNRRLTLPNPNWKRFLYHPAFATAALLMIAFVILIKTWESPEAYRQRQPQSLSSAKDNLTSSSKRRDDYKTEKSLEQRFDSNDDYQPTPIMPTATQPSNRPAPPALRATKSRTFHKAAKVITVAPELLEEVAPKKAMPSALPTEAALTHIKQSNTMPVKKKPLTAPSLTSLPDVDDATKAKVEDEKESRRPTTSQKMVDLLTPMDQPDTESSPPKIPATALQGKRKGPPEEKQKEAATPLFKALTTQVVSLEAKNVTETDTITVKKDTGAPLAEAAAPPLEKNNAAAIPNLLCKVIEQVNIHGVRRSGARINVFTNRHYEWVVNTYTPSGRLQQEVYSGVLPAGVFNTLTRSSLSSLEFRPDNGVATYRFSAEDKNLAHPEGIDALSALLRQRHLKDSTPQPPALEKAEG